jgi:hypothetical protein
VAEAVASVLGQSLVPKEVIVCDDGSTDDPAGALEPFGDAIILLRQANGGVASARNLGLRRATAEFVAVCDADDLYLPNLLQRWAELAQARPDLDILCSDALIQAEGVIRGRSCYDPDAFPVDDQRLAILRDNFVPGRSAFRRRLLLEAGGYDESLVCAEDWDAWIRLILGGARAGLVDEPLALTRINPGSLTSSEVRLRQGQQGALTRAVRRTDLSPAERSVAEDHLAFVDRLLELAEARQAVEEGWPDRRRRCLAVALSSAQPAASRAKAAFAAAFPETATRRTGRQPRPDFRTGLVAADRPDDP